MMKASLNLNDEILERLLNCKKTKKRIFHDWTLADLTREAIKEFCERYEPKEKDK